jgi:biotin transport system permease protein
VISLHRPGSSLLHRLPAGVKLAVLAVAALLVSLWPHTPLTATLAFAAVFGMFLLGGFGPSVWAGQLWGTRWIVVLVAGSQLLFNGPEEALTATVRVVSVVLLAGLLTLTTRSEDLLDALERMLRPLRRIGVDSQRVAFTLSLTIALIPVIAGFARRVREAQQARGVRLGPRAIVPLLVMSLRHADEVADAMTARGVG